jgi:hypothetical protein
MNRNVARWLLALYPSAWRERYGSEVVSLSEELIGTGETTPLRAGLDLAAGAAIERGRSLVRSRRPALVLAVVAMIVAGGTVTLIQTWQAPTAANSASLNCFIAKPPVPAGLLPGAPSPAADHNGDTSQVPARHRPACASGRLRRVHLPAGTRPGTRTVRFPPASNP